MSGGQSTIAEMWSVHSVQEACGQVRALLESRDVSRV